MFDFVGINFSVFWKAFKTVESAKKSLSRRRRFLKGLSPSTTPFGKRKLYEDCKNNRIKNSGFVNTKMQM
jgi:hypothetical protein